MKFFCIPLFTCKHGIGESLDYSQLRLEEVPKEIIKSRKLVEELLLQTNSIEELPVEFFRCTKLRKLDVSENKIKVLPAEVAALHLLADLNLSKNEFVELPEEIGECRLLSALNISTNIVPNLPKSIINLAELTHLNVSDNPLTQLPADINRLVSLQYLDASQCELRFLPASIVQLANLRMLDLCENYLIELPRGMDGLVSLEVLDLHNNAITVIPEEILHCGALKCLDMTKNHLVRLPDELGELHNLRELYICDNQIAQLPNSIGRLKNLETLKASKNCLRELTQSICSCDQLTDLILCENQLCELPSSLGNLKRLQFLDLNVNNLSSVPLTIGHCSALTILHFRHNQLKELPMDIGRLSNLRVLDLIDNNLTYLPYTVTVLYQSRLCALLLSFTQPSLPKLSVTNEPVMNLKVLTCYLLPQRGENPNDAMVSKPRSCVGGARVCFANDGPSITEDEEKLPVGRFERYDTPHPKPFAPKNIANRNSVDLSAAAGVCLVTSGNGPAEKMTDSENIKTAGKKSEIVEIRPLRSVLKRPRSTILPQTDDSSANHAEQQKKSNEGEMSTADVEVACSREREPSVACASEIVTVTVRRPANAASPGLHITGGGADTPLKIAAITANKLTAGQLIIGDRLLTVNGVDVRNASHEQAMFLLSENVETYLVVERRTASPRSSHRAQAPLPLPNLNHACSMPSLVHLSALSPTSPPPIPPRTFNRGQPNSRSSRCVPPNRSIGCLFDLAALEPPTSMAPPRPAGSTSAFAPVRETSEPSNSERFARMMDFDQPLATSSPIPHEARSLIPLPKSTVPNGAPRLSSMINSTAIKPSVTGTKKPAPPPVAPKPTNINPERLNFSSKLQRFEEEINAQQLSRNISTSTAIRSPISSTPPVSVSGSASCSNMRRSGIPMKKPLVSSEDLEKFRAEVARKRQETVVTEEEDTEIADSVGELLSNDACFNQIIASGKISGPVIVRTRNAEIRAEKARALATGRSTTNSPFLDEPSSVSLTPDEMSISRASSSMSTLEQRAADLEKRHAWRKARLKSMDVESQRTDDVLKLITSIPPSPIPIK